LRGIQGLILIKRIRGCEASALLLKRGRARFRVRKGFVEVLMEGNHRQVNILGFVGVNPWVMALFLAWGARIPVPD